MRSLVAILLISFVLTGCATRQTMGRDEFINTTTRSYSNVSEREFYNAAERLFRLSDEDDYEFAYPGEHAMVAQRDWLIYVVLAFAQGTHTWQIETEPTENGVNATAYVSLRSSTVTGTPTGGGGATTHTSPTMQNIVNTPAVYELFWTRMDYLLGKSESWPTCSDWQSRIDSGDTYGLIEPLCLAANTDDLLPKELRKPEEKEDDTSPPMYGMR